VHALRPFLAGALIAAGVAGCGSSSRTFQGTVGAPRISLWWDSDTPTIAYPVQWHVYRVKSGGGSFSFLLAFLSNHPLSLSTPPGCRVNQPVQECAPSLPSDSINPKTGGAICRARNTVSVCAPLPSHLSPGQASVMWAQWDGLPLWRPGRFGKHLRIDGHDASQIVRRRGPLPCPAQANESIVGRVFYRLPGLHQGVSHPSWYEMDACLRGPNLSRLHAQVLAIFRSIRQLP